MPWFKRDKVRPESEKSSEKDDDESKEAKEPPLPKVSLRKLWRYSSGTDLLMLFIGCTVAIVTGAGLPVMAIVLGDISESFVKATILLNYPYLPVNTSHGWMVFEDVYSKQDFSDDMIRNCLIYVVIGVIMVCSAFTQVMCFLVSGENLVHRMRKAFFSALLRQDIAYFDKTPSGTLTTKMFDNLERIKEGTGDKVGLLIQYLSQFVSGYVIAFVYDWKLTLIMMSLSPFLIICGGFMARV
jgi:ATP-binding cassette subfamily B (MDR/TAP) protein 1